MVLCFVNKVFSKTILVTTLRVTKTYFPAKKDKTFPVSSEEKTS